MLGKHGREEGPNGGQRKQKKIYLPIKEFPDMNFLGPSAMSDSICFSDCYLLVCPLTACDRVVQASSLVHEDLRNSSYSRILAHAS